MKKLILLFVAALAVISGIAQTNLDSAVSKQGKILETVSKDITVIKTDVDSAKKYIATQKENTAKATTTCNGCDISFTEWLLIFSPIWIFIIALFVIRKKLKDFSLKDALAETEFPKKTIPNPEYTALNINGLVNNAAISGILPTLIPPTIEVTASTEYPKSSSRYIAFITSALTWIIVLCLSCFFLYQYVKTNIPPKLDGLSSILLALGIGVVPYAFNKVSEAVK